MGRTRSLAWSTSLQRRATTPLRRFLFPPDRRRRRALRINGWYGATIGNGHSVSPRTITSRRNCGGGNATSSLVRNPMYLIATGHAPTSLTLGPEAKLYERSAMGPRMVLRLWSRSCAALALQSRADSVQLRRGSGELHSALRAGSKQSSYAGGLVSGELREAVYKRHRRSILRFFGTGVSWRRKLQSPLSGQPSLSPEVERMTIYGNGEYD